MDFSLVDSKGYSTATLSQLLKRHAKRLGLQAGVFKLSDEKTVGSFFLRFEELLHPLGLTLNRSQKLSIKMEVDKRPPAGGDIEETLLQEPMMFLTNHYTLSSLFSTKLHAILFRPYVKGRDYFDLLYYLGKKMRPKLSYFQNAAKQTHPELKFPDMASVHQALRHKLENLDEGKVRRDVEPFLLEPTQGRYLTKAILLKALEKSGL